MTDRENDFNRTAKDSEGRKVQQELERQLRELGDTMSDSFRHGFEGRGEEIGDRVWDVGRAAVNAAGYGISEAGRAFQAGKQEYQKRAEEASSSASARSACRLRSWNSSRITSPTPLSSGSCWIIRVRMPSVTTSSRVFAPTQVSARIR